MSDILGSLSVDLWDHDTVYRLVQEWMEKEGKSFLGLPPSQAANFARATGEIDDPDEMTPSLEGAARRTKLEQWLEDAVKRGDERGPWNRSLADGIPALFQGILLETLGNHDLAENKKFYRIWGEQPPEDVIKQRKLAVLREATAALVKCYRPQRPRKGAAHGK
jgi:hypothetical protein